MQIPGYLNYQRREFCRDIKCKVQRELDRQKEQSPEYEKVRLICKNNCRYTTYQFHHWLIDKGYLIVRPESER